MSFKLKLTLSLLLLPFLTLTLLAGCREGHRDPPMLPPVPTYLGAEEFVEWPVETTPYTSKQHTSFFTEDSPETVIAFYRTTLAENAWVVGEENPSKTPFILYSSCQLSRLYIRIGVRLDSNAGVKRAVDLDLDSFYCD